MPNGDATQDVARRRMRRVELAAVVAVSLVASVPFCNKAFHIDDPLYLNIAEQILVNPLRPFDGRINWQQVTEPVWNVSISPPGYSYWLAFWMALGVRGELGLHVVGAFWIVLLGVATYSWADRLATGDPKLSAEPFGRWPVAAAVIVVTSPLVVAGQNLMLDVPMLALASSALVVYLAASDRNSVGLAAVAGVLAGVAVNVKYAGIVATAVMGCDALLFRRWRLLVAAVTGAALLAAGQWASAAAYGTPQLLYARQWIQWLWPSGWSDALHRTSSAVMYLGSSAVWLVMLAPIVLRRPAQSIVLSFFASAAAVGTAIDVRVHEPDVTAMALGHAAVFAFSGAMALGWSAIELVRALWRMPRGRANAEQPQGGPQTDSITMVASRADSRARHLVMLAVWTGGFWYLGTLNGPFVAPRALLPCVLGCVLAVVSLAPELHGGARYVVRAGVGLGAVAGMLIGAADYGWAGLYRDWAPQLAARHRPAAGTLYFFGHWGWQHYAAAAGITQLDPSRMRFQSGDVVIVPANVDCPLPLDVVLRGCHEIGRERVPSVGWLPRTRNPPGGVFLHGDTSRGRIPWGWPARDAPLEVFVIYRIGDADAE